MNWIIEQLKDEWNSLGLLILGCIIIFVGLYVQDTISDFLNQLINRKK